MPEMFQLGIAQVKGSTISFQTALLMPEQKTSEKFGMQNERFKTAPSNLDITKGIPRCNNLSKGTNSFLSTNMLLVKIKLFSPQNKSNLLSIKKKQQLYFPCSVLLRITRCKQKLISFNVHDGDACVKLICELYVLNCEILLSNDSVGASETQNRLALSSQII